MRRLDNSCKTLETERDRTVTMTVNRIITPPLLSVCVSPVADLGQVTPDLVAVLPRVAVILDPEVVAHQATAGQGIPLAIHAGHPGVLNKKK